MPGSSSAPAGGRARHYWSCTADTPAGARRGAKTAFFSRGPAPPGGCLCSAHRPSPSLREEEKPAPVARILQAPQSRSNLNDSLKVGGGVAAGKGREQEPSAASSPPPPRPQNSPVRTAPRVTEHVPSPHTSLRACRTHWPVSGGGASRGWPEGRVGPPKSHQFSTRFSKRRGGGMRAGASAACHHGRCRLSQALRGTKIRVSQSLDAMTPLLRH